jgi:hypothetical protein
MTKDYIAMTLQSLMTLTEDNMLAMRCTLHWPVFAGYCNVSRAMLKLKGDRKTYRNSANFE